MHKVPQKVGFPHLGAFESTRLIGSGTDILGTTRHIEMWEHDLDLLRASGIKQLRYSVPWHRIEVKPGVFDFSWIDGPMGHMQRHGMSPILDPLHHVSFPDWLDEGFLNPEFPARYVKFVLEIARRYPWANQWTIFNEPLPTLIHCTITSVWYPHHSSDHSFVRMTANAIKAICLASAALKHAIPSVQFIHVDTAEVHRPLDQKSEEWVDFANHRRFMMHDLLLGKVDQHHALYSYLRINGMTDDELKWFSDNGASFDVLGLDYYMHSELEWYWDKKLNRANIGGPLERADGFTRIGKTYSDRFHVPVMLTETNIRGTFTDRLTWLKFMEEQCEALASQVDFRGFCWYPSIDSTDWCHLCAKCTYSVDPQGIWGLDSTRWNREASELSHFYRLLARGEANSAHLPAYEFSDDLAVMLKGFSGLMAHWPAWEEPDELQEAV